MFPRANQRQEMHRDVAKINVQRRAPVLPRIASNLLTLPGTFATAHRAIVETKNGEEYASAVSERCKEVQTDSARRFRVLRNHYRSASF